MLLSVSTTITEIYFLLLCLTLPGPHFLFLLKGTAGRAEGPRKRALLVTNMKRHKAAHLLRRLLSSADARAHRETRPQRPGGAALLNLSFPRGSAGRCWGPGSSVLSAAGARMAGVVMGMESGCLFLRVDVVFLDDCSEWKGPFGESRWSRMGLPVSFLGSPFLWRPRALGSPPGDAGSLTSEATAVS